MAVIVLFIITISVQPEYYTNTNYIYELTGNDSIVYCATNGGVIAYNYLNGSFKVLTNTDGLQLNRQTCLGVDSSGYIWVGNESGLALIDPNFSNVLRYPVSSLPNSIVQEIICTLDTIFVGTAGGLLIIDTKGTPQDFTDDVLEVKYQYDGLPSDNVLSVASGDTLLWVGTDDGLASFNKDFLSPPIIWTTSNGLLNNKIDKIAVIDTTVYVGTELGLNRFRGDYFDTLVVNHEIKDISYAGDSLVLALEANNQGGIYYQGSLIVINKGLPTNCRVLS